mmetsp:Transcript_28863/g.44349  ORF Transcript_28863/g.44349 Transcript_28863/m.44349 type:complete len:105 (-) Transcript_28863:353-667(-)
MFDSAKYHLIYGPEVPVIAKMKKADCRQYPQSKSMEFNDNMRVKELEVFVRQCIKDKEEHEFAQLLKSANHVVLFTPTYHSNLVPIELTWARIKGNDCWPPIQQ